MAGGELGGLNMLRGLCAAALLLVLLTSATAPALAEGVEAMTTVEQEHLSELTEWAYRNGATTTAPDCGKVCSDLWLSEHRPMPNQPVSDALWSELNELEEYGAAEEGIGLLPDLSVVSPFGPYFSEIALGAAAFTLGWKIGGAIDKWIGLGVPAKPPSFEAEYIEWVPRGETIQFITYHEIMAMPYSGFAVFSPHLLAIVAQSSAGMCGSHEASAAPADFTLLHWHWNECFNGYYLPELPITAYGLVVKPSVALATPIQDYSGQVVDGTSSGVRDPGAEVVEVRLREALDSGGYPVLNQWLDHELGGASEDPQCAPVEGASTVTVPSITPGETARAYEACLGSLGLTEHVEVTVPVGKAVLTQPARGVVGVEPAEGETVDVGAETQVTVKLNPDPLPDPADLEGGEECELSSGEFPVAPPANDPTPEAFDQITDPLLVERPTFLSSHGNTALRWGDVTAEITEAGVAYPGWGYQHIKARHGWTSADERASRTALLTSAFPNREFADAYDFIGPEYVQNRKTCVRQVIVNYGIEGSDPAARGIITSYGRPLEELPGFMRPAE